MSKKSSIFVPSLIFCAHYAETQQATTHLFDGFRQKKRHHRSKGQTVSSVAVMSLVKVCGLEGQRANRHSRGRFFYALRRSGLFVCGVILHLLDSSDKRHNVSVSLQPAFHNIASGDKHVIVFRIIRETKLYYYFFFTSNGSG